MPIAVILPAGGGDAETRLTAEALRGQRTAPATTAPSVAAALDAARSLGDGWIWLLDGGVVPKPDALQALLDASARFDRPPALLASTVLTPQGTLDRASAPVAEVRRAARVLDACERGCVAIRLARSGSLLVRASTLAAMEVNDGSLVDRDIRWTAALLRREPGALVPDSEAVRSTRGPGMSARKVPARIASSIGMLAELEPGERPWFAVHLMERGAGTLRRRMGR